MAIDKIYKYYKLALLGLILAVSIIELTGAGGSAKFGIF